MEEHQINEQIADVLGRLAERLGYRINYLSNRQQEPEAVEALHWVHGAVESLVMELREPNLRDSHEWEEQYEQRQAERAAEQDEG